MNETLDNKYIEFSKILFEIKGILDIHKIASLNAKQINKTGFGSFFWMVNKLSIQSYVINITKIFEKQKRYELNSIFGILDHIRENDISPLSPSAVEDYIQKNNVYTSQKNNYTEQLKEVINNFCENKNDSLKRLQYARDKIFAHTESIEEQIKDLPSYDEMEQLFSFCFEFIRAISSAYLQVGCHRIDNDDRFDKSMCKLLKDAGIEKVVTEFSD